MFFQLRLCSDGGGFVVVFFFFQAEDGIRDWSVTGVQTCALPISDQVEAFRGAPELTAKAFDAEGFYLIGDAGRLADPADPNAGVLFDGRVSERSEERRVGKECITEGSAVHGRTKVEDNALTTCRS